jgi:hypothetical protein
MKTLIRVLTFALFVVAAYFIIAYFFDLPFDQYFDKRRMQRGAEEHLQALYDQIHYSGNATSFDVIDVRYYDSNDNPITSPSKYARTKKEEIVRRITCRFEWRDSGRSGATEVVYNFKTVQNRSKIVSHEVIRSDAITRQDMQAFNDAAEKIGHSSEIYFNEKRSSSPN